jgi:hypothetical protein
MLSRQDSEINIEEFYRNFTYITKIFTKEKNEMKRKLIALSATVFAFFFFTGIGIGQAQDSTKRFSLKFTGGYGTAAFKGINTLFEDLNTSMDSIAQLTGGTRTGEFGELNKWGFDLEGELIVNLAGGFGVGIGAGYIEQRSMDSEVGVSEPIWFGELTTSVATEFSAIPASLSLYYFLPLTPIGNIYVSGGIDYYFGRWTLNARVEEDLVLYPPPSWTEYDFEVKDQGFGFHGGAGVEFNLGSNIGLFVEGKGKYCRLKSWKGKESAIDSVGASLKLTGTMWYVEVESIPGSGVYQPTLTISDVEPSVPGIRNVRKFETDISGVSFRAGIRIKF